MNPLVLESMWNSTISPSILVVLDHDLEPPVSKVLQHWSSAASEVLLTMATNVISIVSTVLSSISHTDRDVTEIVVV